MAKDSQTAFYFAVCSWWLARAGVVAIGAIDPIRRPGSFGRRARRCRPAPGRRHFRITTVKEYNCVAATRRPESRESPHKPMPIERSASRSTRGRVEPDHLAHGSTGQSVKATGGKTQVELVLIDDPRHADAAAASPLRLGDPRQRRLFSMACARTARVLPRVYHRWTGRRRRRHRRAQHHQTMADLRGQTVACPELSVALSSQRAINAGVQPGGPVNSPRTRSSRRPQCRQEHRGVVSWRPTSPTSEAVHRSRTSRRPTADRRRRFGARTSLKTPRHHGRDTRGVSTRLST